MEYGAIGMMFVGGGGAKRFVWMVLGFQSINAGAGFFNKNQRTGKPIAIF